MAIKSQKQLDQMIDRFVVSADKLNANVHDIAMAIVDRAIDNGDCSRAQHLINKMPKSFRRTQLALWFHTGTPIVVKVDDDTWNAKMHKAMTAKNEPNKLYVAFNREWLAANPWHKLADANPESTKTYDLAELIKMATRLGKVISDKVKEGKVPEADTAAATELVARLGKVADIKSILKAVNTNKPEPMPKAKNNVTAMKQSTAEAMANAATRASKKVAKAA